MQTNGFRHISDVLAGLGLIDGVNESGGVQHTCAHARRVTDAQGEVAPGLPGAREERGPKLRLVWSEGRHISPSW